LGIYFARLKKVVRVNSSRIHLERFLSEAAKSLPSGSIILDAGAGDCRYKSLFSHVRYESADFCEVDKHYGELTHVCDLTRIPVEDFRYDAVICTQVLEHIPEPTRVLTELHRVLKPQGKLWLSAPFYYEEHEKPYDFFRYTRYGLSYLLELSGFTIVRMEWLEGYYGTLSYQLKKAAGSLSLKSKNYGGGCIGLAVLPLIAVLKPVCFLLSVLFSYLDIRWKYVSSGHNKNYAIIAEKTHDEA